MSQPQTHQKFYRTCQTCRTFHSFIGLPPAKCPHCGETGLAWRDPLTYIYMQDLRNMARKAVEVPEVPAVPEPTPAECGGMLCEHELTKCEGDLAATVFERDTLKSRNQAMRSNLAELRKVEQDMRKEVTLLKSEVDRLKFKDTELRAHLAAAQAGLHQQAMWTQEYKHLASRLQEIVGKYRHGDSMSPGDTNEAGNIAWQLSRAMKKIEP